MPRGPPHAGRAAVLPGPPARRPGRYRVTTLWTGKTCGTPAGKRAYSSSVISYCPKRSNASSDSHD
jgi:hypothetical protein